MLLDIRPTKTRRSRFKREPIKRPVCLTPRQEQMREAIKLVGFMTTSQICRWVFGKESALPYCREGLRKMFDAGVLDRLFLFGVHGSPQTVYALRRRNRTMRSQYFLQHALLINEFVLSLRDAIAGQTGIEIKEIFLERSLRKNMVVVRVNGRSTPLIPDCCVRLQVDIKGQAFEMFWAVEIDRGTESNQAFSRKVAEYLAFAEGPCQQVFGTDALTVVVLTTAGPRRVANLQTAVEERLVALRRQEEADLFRIGSVDFDSDSPRAVFAEPRFLVPFVEAKVGLLHEYEVA